MKRCVCCGQPAIAAFCGACQEVIMLPWAHPLDLSAWTKVAVSALGTQRREIPYRP